MKRIEFGELRIGDTAKKYIQQLYKYIANFSN